MDTSSIPLKRCTKCGQEFPATLGYFHKKRKSLTAACKICEHARSANYRSKNADKVRERHRRYRVANPTKNREYYLEHRDTIRKQQRQYRIVNSDWVQECNKKWRELNPEKIRVNNQRRRARKNELSHTFTDADWRRALIYFDNRCAVCGRPMGLWHTLAREHWIPIDDPRPDNPGTVPMNIVPMCHGQGGCNNSKHNRDPIEWLVNRVGKRKAKQILEHINAYFEWVEHGLSDKFTSR